MRIGILDDDQSQTEFATLTLSAAGHSCHAFARGAALVQELRRQTFDLLVLDWNVPDMPGDEVLAWTRKNLVANVPVLFMTSRDQESDIVAALSAGADDYVVKPVPPRILLARVNTLLRRAYLQGATSTRETFGDYIFDLNANQVSLRGENIPITQKEFELALLFFRNLARPLSRSHIVEMVWKHTVDLPSRTMDTHVSLIRTKLNLRPQNGYRLAPIYSYGYRLEKLDEA
jgi:DNA-binding response OmpR family regulator